MNSSLDSSPDGLPCDTEAGLLYLKQLFPVEKFQNILPPLVLKHQVYSIIHDKTTVDREIVSYLCNVSRYLCFSRSNTLFTWDTLNRLEIGLHSKPI